MKRKVKVTIDGQEREVEIELPDTMVDTAAKEFNDAFIPMAVHNVQMAAARREGAGPKKEDLLKDEAFRGEALKAWGIDPKGKGTGATDEEAVQKAVALATAPLTQERDQLKGTLGKLLETTLDADIERFAREAGVKDEFLARATPNGKPVIVALLRENFGYAAEQGYHAAKGAKEGEFAYSPKATSDRPWLDVPGFFESWKVSDAAKPFVKDPRQRISGPSPTGQGPATTTATPAPGGQVSKVISRQEASNPGADLEGIAKGTVVVE